MSDDYTARLREAIIRGELMPNERLVEERLVELLGTNRTNVRSALVRLDHEGLVALEKNRGARVRLVSEGEAIEIAEARAVLEILVARHAARNATPQDCAALEAIMDKMREVYNNGDLMAYSDINGVLHGKIREIAAHATAAKLLANLKSQVVRFQYRAILLPGRARESIGEHEQVVEGICANDVAAAENAMRKHMEGVVRGLAESIRSTKQHLL